MWSEKDEKAFQKLLTRRTKSRKGEPGHDITFKEALLLGQEGEQIVSKALKGEVKRDFGAGNTGNVFVEFESRGKASGIATTKADWWVFLLSGGYDDEVFVGIRTERLKEIMDSIKWEVRGGDGRTSKGKLVPVRRLIK